MSEEISENVFPSEDIDELKKGVEFDNLDEAQQNVWKLCKLK